MPGHVDRARAAGMMEAAGLDALLVVSPEAFAWATGAPAGVAAGWRRLGAAMAVIPADPGQPVGAVASDLFAPSAQAAGCAPLRTHPIWPEALSLRAVMRDGASAAELVAAATADRPPGFARPATFDRAAALAELRALLSDQRLATARLGVEFSAVPAADLAALEAAIAPARLADASALLDRLRAHKSPAEIALLRQAGAITEAAFHAFIPAMREGATRPALGRHFLDLVQQHGRDATAPVTAWEYVGFGTSPWSSPGGLQRGYVIKVDVGAVVGGYSADLARTFTLGPAPCLAKEVFAPLLDAFEAGRALFRPGTELRKIHETCLRTVREAGFPSYARGHFGHGLGASIWSEEWPFTAADSEVVLEPGMVMAFELPWYLDGIGGFIVEDMLLVTDTGAETLAGATLPRGLVEL
ncbi:M24 family metallopeptidase [Falsiroseomonas ponticola]|uniref:M24 family metallopeptidase n=1 Tax=Falsiroseomonas ponticola TaxID=2786951 RepID=UPI0019314CC7|nr:Xaa-Pro peptidase family protein [Roseomonas ponticola]